MLLKYFSHEVTDPGPSHGLYMTFTWTLHDLQMTFIHVSRSWPRFGTSDLFP